MIDAKTYAQYATDPAAFRADLNVDVDGSVRRFGDVMDDWQRDDFAAIDSGLMRAAGRSDKPAKLRAYLERHRGASKTHDLALMACWMLAFATRPIRGYAFAVDRDQAALLKDAMEKLCMMNLWLNGILGVRKNLVVNKAEGHPGSGSKLEIFTSDVASSYGILPDFIIADELAHWQGDGSLWHSILSSAAKRSCFLCVISNAGFIDSWIWQVREAARTDPDNWTFSRLDGPVASWLTPERLAEQRRMLPSIAYNRLWENQWSAAGGDALTPADIAAAFHDDLEPMTGTEAGWMFVGGVDLGLTRDCSSVVALAVPVGGVAGRIRLAANKLWRPIAGRKIDLMEVERHILELDERFNLQTVAFDPWQHELLAQRLEADSGHKRRSALKHRYARGPWMREIPPTAANVRQQATLTVEYFGDRRLQFYDCEPLRRDLLKLRVEEKSYGFRLVSPRDGEGHGDTFSAFSLALLVAHELAGKKRIVAGSMIDGGSIVAGVGIPDAGSGLPNLPPGLQLDLSQRDRAFKRLLSNIDYRQRSRERERERLEAGGNNTNGAEEWKTLMRRCGRL